MIKRVTNYFILFKMKYIYNKRLIKNLISHTLQRIIFNKFIFTESRKKTISICFYKSSLMHTLLKTHRY